jgi:hypothetical protein
MGAFFDFLLGCFNWIFGSRKGIEPSRIRLGVMGSNLNWGFNKLVALVPKTGSAQPRGRSITDAVRQF